MTTLVCEEMKVASSQAEFSTTRSIALILIVVNLLDLILNSFGMVLLIFSTIIFYTRPLFHANLVRLIYNELFASYCIVGGGIIKGIWAIFDSGVLSEYQKFVATARYFL